MTRKQLVEDDASQYDSINQRLRRLENTQAGQRNSNEFTANSGSLASGAESATITVTHNIGFTPSVVMGHLEDGSWSHQCGWRVASRTTTTVAFRFLNNGPNVATAVLRFRLVY